MHVCPVMVCRYPIYCWAADKVISTVIPGDLGIPVLRHCHHVWPHYVQQADGTRQLYLLIHGMPLPPCTRAMTHALRWCTVLCM